MEPRAGRRDGAETRRAIQRIALELFTQQGFEPTSLREIAERLGIRKASLYYHFPNKQAILRSLFEERGAEAEQLLAWAQEQPRTPRLLQEVVPRWVESYSADKLAGIRFVRANPLVARSPAGGDGERIGDPLSQVAALLGDAVPDASPADLLLIRMALLSINAAVEASASTDIPDDVVLEAAREAAMMLVRGVVDRPEPQES